MTFFADRVYFVRIEDGRNRPIVFFEVQFFLRKAGLPLHYILPLAVVLVFVVFWTSKDFISFSFHSLLACITRRTGYHEPVLRYFGIIITSVRTLIRFRYLSEDTLYLKGLGLACPQIMKLA